MMLLTIEYIYKEYDSVYVYAVSCIIIDIVSFRSIAQIKATDK